MLGLELAGFKTLLANEVHPHPCLTLRRNFPGTPVVEGSIRDFSARDLYEKANLSWEKRPEVHLVAGGPPCQGFSTAGMKDAADPRNSLIGDFIRIVDEVRPHYFIMENVTGLQTMYEGKLFERTLEQFDGLGYSFHAQILNASEYGVPQMRRRLVILGAREGSCPPHPLPSHSSVHRKGLFDSALSSPITCGEALADLPQIQQGEIATEYDQEPITAFQHEMRKESVVVYNHQASRHKPETAEYYSLVPLGGTWLDIPPRLRKLKQGMQRWPLDGIARTVTTEPTDFLHPTLNRIPTVRELARIQTFPDRYEFCGQRTTGNKMRRLGYCSQTQQVGNAVPPFLARAVGRAILQHARLPVAE